jgi:hypothetical protein
VILAPFRRPEPDTKGANISARNYFGYPCAFFGIAFVGGIEFFDVVVIFKLPNRTVILRQVKLAQEIAAVHPVAVCSNESVVDPRMPRGGHHGNSAQAADVGRQIGGALR